MACQMQNGKIAGGGADGRAQHHAGADSTQSDQGLSAGWGQIHAGAPVLFGLRMV